MADWVGLGRAALRGVVYPAVPARSFLEYWIGQTGRDLQGRVEWLQRTALAHARWVNLDIRVRGTIPREGLVVCNHVSYLDIVALSAIGRYAFVAKKEVAGWPLFGTYARLGATIFVDRERRGAVTDVSREMASHLDSGVPLVLFPEGTSTDGSRVLPFRSSLLEPVVQLRSPITACGLRYILKDGNPGEEVAYWGDMTLVPHLLNLLRKRGVRVELCFGSPRESRGDRKRLARELHEEVRILASV
jgi:lyso-ornithine lipid O-acyltransferase